MENIRRKNGFGCMFVSIIMLFFMNSKITRAQSSINYTVEKAVFDESGNFSQSTGYTVEDATGQSSPLDICASTNYSESSGFWGRGGGMPTAVGERSEEKVPARFNLYQNYPNPFNPETKIRFALTKNSHVVITIYNTLGQQIGTLIDTQYAPGFHDVRWDGKDRNGSPVSSGVYLYRIQAGEFSQVRKMILIR